MNARQSPRERSIVRALSLDNPSPVGAAGFVLVNVCAVALVLYAFDVPAGSIAIAAAAAALVCLSTLWVVTSLDRPGRHNNRQH